MNGGYKMEKQCFATLKICIILSVCCITIITAAYGEIYRDITEKGAIHMRSEYTSAYPFDRIELLKFPNGFTELRVFGFNFDAYSEASLVLDNRSYKSPLILKKALSVHYKINEISGNKGIELDNAILASQTIDLKININDGLNKAVRNISLPQHVIDEWKTVLLTDIYSDCIDGIDLCAISSSYDLIQWGCRGDNVYYSFDILNSDGTEMLYSAIKTGVELHRFYPATEAPQLEPGVVYTWKVWSTPFESYGGKGFEGSFYVPFPDDMNVKPYLSTNGQIQWPGRCNGDYFYCIDIFDKDWKMINRAAACGAFLHSFSPEVSLDLSAGDYNWIIWSSPSYSYGGYQFEGSFSVIPYVSTYALLQWPEKMNGDSFYCVDIFNSNGKMLYQAVDCGEKLHSFKPEQELNLGKGEYKWKIWSSPSEAYGGDGFEGEFTVF